MNKFCKHLNLLLFLGAGLFFFSCKKDHVCVCGGMVDGVSTTIHDTAAKAKKTCDAMDAEFETNCELE